MCMLYSMKFLRVRSVYKNVAPAFLSSKGIIIYAYTFVLVGIIVTNSRNWSRISVDNSAASLLPGLWVGPMFSPCSDLLK